MLVLGASQFHLASTLVSTPPLHSLEISCNTSSVDFILITDTIFPIVTSPTTVTPQSVSKACRTFLKKYSLIHQAKHRR